MMAGLGQRNRSEATVECIKKSTPVSTTAESLTVLNALRRRANDKVARALAAGTLERCSTKQG